MYMTHSLLIPKEIEFIKEVPDAAFFINTDVNRLSQIMTNFLNNATKFTKSGYIKLGYEIDFSTYEVSIYVEVIRQKRILRFHYGRVGGK